jgi:hypothetical protein
VASALLVAAHPITLISVRSGGFDFLAAFFSVLIIKSFLDHCRAPSANRLACVVDERVHVRRAPLRDRPVRRAGGLFLAGLPPGETGVPAPLSLIYALTPAFFLPRIWQAILRGNVPEQDAGAITFSGGNFVTNAVDYFKTIIHPFDGRSPHAAFIIALGVVGCILAIRWMIQRLIPRDRPIPEMQFSAMVAGWMLLQLVIVFTYVWGRPDHPASARLIISIDTFFSFPAAWAW